MKRKGGQGGVSWELNRPDFHFRDAIRQAMVACLRGARTSIIIRDATMAAGGSELSRAYDPNLTSLANMYSWRESRSSRTFVNRRRTYLQRGKERRGLEGWWEGGKERGGEESWWVRGDQEEKGMCEGVKESEG